MATLAGIIRRITFRNDDNHFTVAKLEMDEPGSAHSLSEVTVVGHFPSLAVGEWIELDGEWTVHPTFGRQFQATSHRKAPPATTRGILRYLSSGLIEGIGPKLAERLVEQFGERTLEVIEKEPERLLEVPGIGARKQEAITQAVRDEREVQDALVFLGGLGLAPGTAAKIYRQYESETISKVKENPYRLADEVFGIGFHTADNVAREMGLALDSPHRAAAAIVYLLNQSANEGHLFLPESVLMEAAADLDVPESAAQSALETLAQRHEIVLDVYSPGERAVYPSFLHRAEVEVARRLKARYQTAGSLDLARESQRPQGPDVSGLISRSGLSGEQARAVQRALAPGGGLMVLTGGPGTGKTTTLRAIVEGLKATGRTYHLAAPTGRAAKRLGEATGEEAKTIHRLLEYSGGETGGFRFLKNEKSPLQGDAVIIDEASMIDVPLFFHLLRAIPDETKLILVGDADQLPSVGPGNALADIIRAAEPSVVRLTEIFRQAQQSQIVVNAHRIQQGLRPEISHEDSDFFFVRETDPNKARELICELVSRRLPRYLHCDPRRDVQVLATVRRGPLGVDALNEALQATLNPGRPGMAEVVVGGQRLRPGDRVMQVRNDYDKMVFNGDTGTVKAVDPSQRQVEVLFSDRESPEPVLYRGEEVHQLTLAYSMSVHKSQGSEYPAVVMPITWVMPTLMNRNLLYTAITRAKRLVVLVGQPDAFWRYIQNDRADHRYTMLAERILDEVPCLTS